MASYAVDAVERRKCYILDERKEDKWIAMRWMHKFMSIGRVLPSEMIFNKKCYGYVWIIEKRMKRDRKEWTRMELLLEKRETIRPSPYHAWAAWMHACFFYRNISRYLIRTASFFSASLRYSIWKEKYLTRKNDNPQTDKCDAYLRDVQKCHA